MKGDRTATGYFVGMTTLDYVYYSSEYPERNGKIKIGDYRRFIGGPAANAAITYSLLGGRAVLITCLGVSDEAGMAVESLKSYGVETVNCAADDALLNISSIIVDYDGSRTIFSGQRRFDKLLCEPEYIREKTERFGKPDFCLFDMNQQEMSLKLLDMIGCPVVVDAGSMKDNAMRFVEKAEIVISSENFKTADGKTVFEMDECRNARKAVTRGGKPIIYDGGELAVRNTECVDTLAAGDIFHGAFCFGYYNEKKEFAQALLYAAEIAGESVKYAGPRQWALERGLCDRAEN